MKKEDSSIFFIFYSVMHKGVRANEDSSVEKMICFNCKNWQNSSPLYRVVQLHKSTIQAV